MTELINKIVYVLNDKLAEDISIIDFNHTNSVTDYFIIATAKNYRHANSLVDFLSDELDKLDVEIYHIHNIKDSGWLVIDLGDIVIHIFLNEDRDKYQLEKLWADQIILKM